MAMYFQGEGKIMKIEYDPLRDLLYVYFAEPVKKVAQTKTIMPGVHADFDKGGKIMGIEVLDASEIIGDEVDVKLPAHAKS